MALHWDLGKIKDYKTVCWINEGADKTLNHVTECLIWATMIVDLSSITEKNVEEWMWRIYFLTQLRKIDLVYDSVTKDYRTFTEEEIQAHIGLGTNASTLTRTQFVKRWVDVLKRNCDSQVRYMKQQLRTDS